MESLFVGILRCHQDIDRSALKLPQPFSPAVKQKGRRLKGHPLRPKQPNTKNGLQLFIESI